MRTSYSLSGVLIMLISMIATAGMATASDDVVFANRIPDASRVCLSDGAGGFACSDVDADTYDSVGVAIGRINGDPYLDVIFANSNTAEFDPQVNRVCVGDGYGAFSTCSDVSLDTNFSWGVALGDVDGDDNLDAVFANWGQRNRLCFGDGTGDFTLCIDVSVDTNDTSHVTLGFVDDDPILDALFTNFEQRNRVCLGDGTGGFTCTDINADMNRSRSVALGQVNGDPNLDAIITNGGGQANRVCLGDGMGGFSCSDVSPADPNSKTQSVSLGLIDDDQHLDAVLGNNFRPNRVCLGDGNGAFTCSDVSLDMDSTFGGELGLVNGDDILDAVFANWDGVNRVCLGDGLGGFTCGDVSTEVNVSLELAVGDLDILIFSDGFESGDTSAWSRSVP